MHESIVGDPLSLRQQEAYNALREYFRENDQLPTFNALAGRLGITHNAAYDMVRVLARKGWIERNAAGRYRFARPTTHTAALPRDWPPSADLENRSHP